MDRASLAIVATAAHQGTITSQSPLYTHFRPMETAVSAIAATLTHEIGHFQRQLHAPLPFTIDRAMLALALVHTSVCSFDWAWLAITAAAIQQVFHLQQLLYIPFHSMDRVVFASELCKWPPAAVSPQNLQPWFVVKPLEGFQISNLRSESNPTPVFSDVRPVLLEPNCPCGIRRHRGPL